MTSRKPKLPNTPNESGRVRQIINPQDTIDDAACDEVLSENIPDEDIDSADIEFEEVFDYSDDKPAVLKKEKIIKTVSIIAFSFGAVLAAALIVFIIDFNVLPPLFLAAAIAVIVVLAIIPAVFIFIIKKKPYVMKIIGSVLAVLFAVIFAVGCFYIVITNRAIDTITGEGYSIKIFKVAVKADSKAQTLKDAADYTFGTISSYEAELFEEAMNELNKETGKILNTKDYSAIDKLLDAFYDGDVDGIIYEGALGGVFDDLNENYYKDARIIKEVSLKRPMTDVELSLSKASETASETTEPETEVITTKETETTEPETEAPLEVVEPFIALISGNDEYDEVSVTGRSDVNMLCVVNFETHQLLMISIPRDYYVYLSGICDYQRDKLTHASLYGMDVLVDTINDLLNTNIDYYIRVNFTSVANIIDAIGVLVFYNPYYFECTYYDYVFPEGEVWLDGFQALQYARERKSLENGDFSRGEHQQIIIQAMIDKLVSAESIAHYSALVDAVDECAITTMPEEKIKEIIRYQLETGGEWTMLKAQAMGDEIFAPCYSMGDVELAVVMPYVESLEHLYELINRVYYGEILDPEEVASWESDTHTYVEDLYY